MSVKTIMFDLDGTLLPMDQDIFIKEYFTGLAVKLAPYGYEPKKLMDTIYKGVYAMQTNDGSCNNEGAFWNLFTSIYGEDARKHEPVFYDFYVNEFQNVAKSCGFNPKAREIIDLCKEKGLRILAGDVGRAVGFAYDLERGNGQQPQSALGSAFPRRMEKDRRRIDAPGLDRSAHRRYVGHDGNGDEGEAAPR